MKFGRKENLSSIDFDLPADHHENERVLNKGKKPFDAFIGLPTWNRQLLKGFYPRGTQDELGYYASQFNSIEFNASFYNFWEKQQIQAWVDRTPEDFRFFPKVNRVISHELWLQNSEEPVDRFTESVRVFGSRLGSCFLQLHEKFSPLHMDRLRSFIAYWPADIPLAVELRDEAWFSDPEVTEEVCELFESKDISNIIIDTPGRRDLLHMRLTSRRLFVRFLGCGKAVDFERLKAWSERIGAWQKAGLEEASFFLHHEPEAVTIGLARYIAGELGRRLGKDLSRVVQPMGQQLLF